MAIGRRTAGEGRSRRSLRRGWPAATSAALLLAGAASAQDLIAHWPLDDGAGATATDASGNGHDGTLVDQPYWDPNGGADGGALFFDGDDGVEIPDADALDLIGGELTISAWIHPLAFGEGAGTEPSIPDEGIEPGRASKRSWKHDAQCPSARVA